MDDLDRLYRHLVETLRGEAPHLLRQRFTVGDLSQQLVPYRLHRRALGFDTIQQYDRALLRLAAGERGYLITEPVVRDAARAGLERPGDEDPLRRFADAPAGLAGEPLSALLGQAPPPVPIPPVVPPPPPPAPSADSPFATGAFGGSSSGSGYGSGVGSPFGSQEPVTPPLAPAAAAASVADRPAPPPAPPQAAPLASDPSASMPFPTRPAAAVTGGRCQYCGHALPEGRPVTFCPYCGQNVTVVRCPACSTELEVGWRYCVTCGRAMDAAPTGAAPTGAGPTGSGSTPPGG
ncbi:zinc ribbon domain-containing protein [Roseisolibacter sp. H3M3-2]|uniref:zinc ribbon domain-containing protein n=1 Tax=Roseisolibacter sp. H3M3-2 TaxID=3031323 RepID=UPI0023D9F4A4|nr:zinc ribbon domain-containing protein [Roseisolibacter sp. H3M3-2]MDF1501658.1 zinc ribbon domain-containing protein [Roseisolibacter sp. H3M3-2]